MSLSCAVLGNKFALDRTRGNPYVGQHGVVAISLGAWRALSSIFPWVPHKRRGHGKAWFARGCVLRLS